MKNSLKRQWLYEKWIYFLIFLIPSIIMFLVYAAFGVHPFGDNSVLVLDLNGQYVYYYEALRDAFWGDSSLIYSWSRNLSGEMFGIFGYYLASPFSFITVILPRSMMLFALELMQLFKIGAAALAFSIYIKNSKKSRIFTTIIFSSLYALMGFSVVQLMNPMWLDGVIYLPLIILGLENLINNGRLAGFIIPLSLMFMANFYIGYMVGIFCGAYFVYYTFSREDFPNIKSFVFSLIKFILSAVTAVLCSMIIILPIYNSLKLGKFDFTQPDFSLKAQFTFVSFLTKLLPYSYDTVRPEGLPVIYSGALTLILVPLYFLNKNIKAKEKAANGVLLALIYACMYLSTSDIAMHGFQVPNWLPFRYSFIFSFIMLIIAAKAFENFEGVSFKEISLTFIALCVFLIYSEQQGFSNIKPIESLLPSFLVFAVYYVFLLCFKKYKARKVLIATLVFSCVELFTASLYTLNKIDIDVVYSTYSSYQSYVEYGRETVDKISEIDAGLYRSEKTYHRTVNDPMAFGLKGISHSSSTMNSSAIELLKQLGFTSRGHYTKYNGATKVTDSILGIKYILNKDKDMYDYKYIFTNKDIQVYQNPYALSIGFMADDSIRNVNFEAENPFYNQNQIISKMTNDKTDYVFKKLFVDDIIYENMTVENAGNHTKYTPTIEGINAHIEFKVTAQSDGIIYVFFPSNYERTMNLWVNNNFISVYYETENYCIMPLGEFEKGEEISVIATPTKDDLYMMDQYFYYLDESAFEESIELLKQNQWQIDSFSDTYIEGNITAKENQIMFTSIPYEPGWNITVDGEKVEPTVLLNSLIGIEVPEGTHKVTMEFFPDYFKKGIILSLTGLLVLIVILIIDKRNKSKEVLLKKLYN